MDLQDNILKTFADAVNKSGNSTPDSKTFYGTVIRKDGDTVFVRLDGADETVETPTATMVEVGDGDLVMVSMKNHTATIIGNISYPALTRVGAIYITLTAEGLVIGQLDENNTPVGYHMLITPTDIQLLTLTGKVLARFGDTVKLTSDTYRSEINSSGLQVFNAAGTMLAQFGATSQIGPNNGTHTTINSSGMTVYNSSGKAIVKIGLSAAPDAYGTSVNGMYTVGTIYAEGGPVTVGNNSAFTMLSMVATKGGNIGLYANNQEWLLRMNNKTGKKYLAELDIDRIMLSSSTQLWSGNLVYTNDGVNEYDLQGIDNLHDWNVVLLRVRCGGIYTSVVIAKSSGNAAHYVADPSYTYNSTAYVVKSAYIVDWAHEKVGVKRIAGPTEAASMSIHAIMSVHGLVPDARDSSSGFTPIN